MTEKKKFKIYEILETAKIATESLATEIEKQVEVCDKTALMSTILDAVRANVGLETTISKKILASADTIKEETVTHNLAGDLIVAAYKSFKSGNPKQTEKLLAKAFTVNDGSIETLVEAIDSMNEEAFTFDHNIHDHHDFHAHPDTFDIHDKYGDEHEENEDPDPRHGIDSEHYFSSEFTPSEHDFDHEKNMFSTLTRPHEDIYASEEHDDYDDEDYDDDEGDEDDYDGDLDGEGDEEDSCMSTLAFDDEDDEEPSKMSKKLKRAETSSIPKKDRRAIANMLSITGSKDGLEVAKQAVA